MPSQKIRISAFKESVNNIMIRTHNLLRDTFKSLDFKKEVDGVLKTFGYVYELDEQTGDFKIIAAPGCYVKARRDHEHYAITVEMNYNGLSVSGGDKAWIDDRVSYGMPLLISPLGLKHYKFLFEKMIEDLRNEYARYEAINKSDKGAKLLKSMMAPVLRKNKLYRTTVERCDDTTVYVLKKNVLGNIFLETRITFDTYEEGINRMVDAFENLPNWIMDFNELEFRTNRLFYKRFMERVGKGLGLIDNPESNKYFYRYLPVVDSTNNDYSQTDLSIKLNELGYIYYVEPDGKYNIFLNKNTLLCRNNNAVWIKQHLGQPLSETYFIEDTEFYILMKILTWGCPTDDMGDYWTLPRLMAESIKKVLPESVDEYSIFHGGFGIHYKNMWYMIDIANKQWISLTEKVINYMRADNDIMNYLKFPGMEIIIKE